MGLSKFKKFARKRAKKTAIRFWSHEAEFGHNLDNLMFILLDFGFKVGIHYLNALLNECQKYFFWIWPFLYLIPEHDRLEEIRPKSSRPVEIRKLCLAHKRSQNVCRAALHRLVWRWTYQARFQKNRCKERNIGTHIACKLLSTLLRIKKIINILTIFLEKLSKKNFI